MFTLAELEADVARFKAEIERLTNEATQAMANINAHHGALQHAQALVAKAQAAAAPVEEAPVVEANTNVESSTAS